MLETPIAPPTGGRAIDRLRAVTARDARSSRASRGDRWTGRLFLAPATASYLLFVALPAFAGLALAFFEWDLFDEPQFVGTSNITRLFSDEQVWSGLTVTTFFVVAGVIPTILVGFILAVLLNTHAPGVVYLRILYFAPLITSAAVSSVIWANLYDPKSGLVNQTLALAGIQGPNWLTDVTWSAPALVVVMIWSALPFVIILYLAALQSIPADIYAAAALDGAGLWRRIASITWPSVAGTTGLIAVLQGINFMSGSLEIGLIMTDGGPLGRTTSLALYAYKEAFVQRDIGYASAITVLQLAIVGVVVGIVATIRRARRSADLA